MSNCISMTIDINPAEASYIAALVELFNTDDIESCYAVRMLPELLFHMTSLLNKQGLNDPEFFNTVADEMHWNDFDRARVAALLKIQV